MIYILIGEKKLKVMALSEIVAMDFNDRDAVLVIPHFYTEFVKQIMAYDTFQNTDNICMTHTLKMIREESLLNVSMPSYLKATKGSIIPRTIHYC